MSTALPTQALLAPPLLQTVILSLRHLRTYLTLLLGAITTPSPLPTPMIAGAIIGTLVALALLFILVFVILRRRQAKQRRTQLFSQEKMVRRPSEGSSFRAAPTLLPNTLSGYYTGMRGPYPTMSPTAGPSSAAITARDKKERPMQEVPEYNGYGYGTGERKEKENLHLSSAYDGIQDSSSYIPLTARQQNVQAQLREWQSKYMDADKRQRNEVDAEVERLQKLLNSDWARELTDEKPIEYF
jgi:hypothetical protein